MIFLRRKDKKDMEHFKHKKNQNNEDKQGEKWRWKFATLIYAIYKDEFYIRRRKLNLFAGLQNIKSLSFTQHIKSYACLKNRPD